jgi:hypothetical protein
MLDATHHFARTADGKIFDPCPYPRPPWDGLTIPWPDRTFINPPFTGDYGSKTAFVRKAIAENQLGKTISGVISSHGGNVINLLLAAGAKLMPIGPNGRVAWIGVKTGKPMPSPVPTLFFILWGKPRDRRPGRPSISDRAMTSAERQARRRVRLRVAQTVRSTSLRSHETQEESRNSSFVTANSASTRHQSPSSDVIPFSRVWAMPSAETFSIPPIRDFVRKYLAGSTVSIDPFARNSRLATFTNDLCPDTEAQYHLDAEDFLHQMREEGVVAD